MMRLFPIICAAAIALVAAMVIVLRVAMPTRAPQPSSAAQARFFTVTPQRTTGHERF